MRSLTFLRLGMVLVGSLVLGASVLAGEALRNGRFDKPISELAEGFTLVKGGGHDGGNALHYRRDSASTYSYQYVEDFVPVSSHYRFGGWVKLAPGASDGAHPGVLCQFSGKNGYISAANAATTVRDGQWQFVSNITPVPAGTTRMEIIVLLPKGYSGQVDFSDLFCQTWPVPATQPVATRLINEDFESNQWSLADLPVGIRLSPEGHAGSTGIECQRADSKEYTYLILGRKPLVGQEYRFGGWGRLDPKHSNSNTQGCIFIQFFSDTKWLGGRDIRFVGRGGSWGYGVAKAIAPAGTNYVELGVNIPREMSGRVIFDDLFCEPVK